MNRKLLSKDFLLLFQAQTISMLGTQAFMIGIVFWIKHATSSATLVGLLGMATAVPLVVLGVVGGAVADRYSRRKIIIVADFVDGVAVLALAALMFFYPQQTDPLLMAIFVVAAILGVVSPFFAPAIMAAIPDLVSEENTAPANSLMHTSVEFASLLGQALGGVLFRILGAPVLLLLNGVSYIFAAVCECFMRIPQAIPESKKDGWRNKLSEFKTDTLDGCRYIYRRSGLGMLVFASSLLSFFSVPIIILLPFYVEDVLRLRTDWYGYILAIYGVGTICGYVAAGAFKPIGKARMRLMIAAMCLESAMAIGIGMAATKYAALAFAGAGGLFGGFMVVCVTTIVQVTTPDDMRGRVFGLLSTISASISPIAMALAGVIADLLHKNIPLIYVGCGVSMACISVAVSMSPAFRTFLGSAPVERAMAASSGEELANGLL